MIDAIASKDAWPRLTGRGEEFVLDCSSTHEQILNPHSSTFSRTHDEAC